MFDDFDEFDEARILIDDVAEYEFYEPECGDDYYREDIDD